MVAPCSFSLTATNLDFKAFTLFFGGKQLSKPASEKSKKDKDKSEAERDDITMVDQEKILRHMPKTELTETRESPED